MSNALPELGDVTRLSPHVIRILGQNPGKFTLQGTNTYLLGTQNPYILIDTGEGLPAYLPILRQALFANRTSSNTVTTDVSDIVISHWHHDHVGGLPGVLTLLKELWVERNPGREDNEYTPPRIHKHPFPASATRGHHHSHYNQLPRLLKELPKGLYLPPPGAPASSSPSDATPAGPDHPGVLHPLHDTQLIQTSDGSTHVQVLHTPGHTADSICLYLPQDRALYTADTVLGHGTAVFEDLALYLTSLNRMLTFKDQAKDGKDGSETIDLAYVSLYPAHGAVVADGRETIATYIKHRLEREAQIVGVLNSPVPPELADEPPASVPEASGSTAPLWSTWNIVRVLYKSYPENLWLPAARGVDLHLRKLEGDGLVKLLVAGSEGEEHKAVWRLLITPPGTPSL